MRIMDPFGEYRRIFFSSYILPWIRYDMESRFGIDPGNEFTTHFSMILSKRPRDGMVSLDTESMGTVPVDSLLTNEPTK